MSQGPKSALHTFIRIARDNSPIDGTNKSLKSAPRQGRWLKVDAITGNVCCDNVTLNTDSPGAGTYLILTFVCDSTTIATISLPELTSTTETLIDDLNTNLPYLGTFSIGEDTDTIDLKINRTSLPPCDGTLTYTMVWD